MKIVIRVLIDKDLLDQLERQARSQQVSRAALIRAACAQYVRQLDDEERTNRYRDGYRRIPEETSEEESRAWLTAANVPVEEWPEAPHGQA